MSKIIEELNQFRRNPALYFDRSFSSGTGKQIGWLVAFFLIVLLLLFLALCLLPGEGSLAEKFSKVLMLLIDPGDSDSIPMFFTVIVDVLGLVIFGGMLISVASNILERRVEAYQNGETTYRLKRHIVIIGYNDSVPSLVRTLRAKPEDAETFILIQSGQDTGDIRNRLHLGLDRWMERNTIVVHGQSNSEEDIRALNISACKQVYVIGDNTAEAHDSVNLDSVAKVAEEWGTYHKEKTDRLHCNVLFEHQTLYNIFQFSELKKEISGALYFHPFNLYENWAKKVLVAGSADDRSGYKPLEGHDGIDADSKKHVHLIVVGMSRMGTALAVEAAQIAHYPNFKENDDTTRTHITFIDANARAEMEVFQARFPNVFNTMRWRYVDARKSDENIYSLTDGFWQNPIEAENGEYRHLGPNFTDLQWEFVDGRVESPAVRKYLTDAVNDDSAITTVAVCLPDTQQATQAALYLPDQALRRAHQILVYQEENDTVIRAVSHSEDKCTRYDNLSPFGLVSDTYSNDLIGEEEGIWINAYWDLFFHPDDEYIRRSWQTKDEEWANTLWNKASVSDKWSSVHSANTLYTKLRTIACTVHDDTGKIRKAMEKDMPHLVSTEHNRWVASQLMAGWRPMKTDEWKEYLADTKVTKRKDVRAHANICSNAMLAQCEPDSHRKDAQVTLALIEIIENNRRKDTGHKILPQLKTSSLEDSPAARFTHSTWHGCSKTAAYAGRVAEDPGEGGRVSLLRFVRFREY